jgi:hypothetical protein
MIKKTIKKSKQETKNTPKKISKNTPKIDCDTIEWLVDILGTTELLSSLIGAPAVNLENDRHSRAELKRDKPNLPNGIYFDGSHWYSVKNNIKKDSYNLNYQIKGTAHFCQTFAVMIYIGEPYINDLVPYNYSYNITIAIDFWLKLFNRYPGYLEYVINEIKTSEWGTSEKYYLYNTNILLKNITGNQFIVFLKRLRQYSHIFVGCKQG